MIRRMPLGRVREYVEKLSEEVKGRTATIASVKLFGDVTVRTFPSRQKMLEFIWKDSKDKDVGQPVWKPLIKE